MTTSILSNDTPITLETSTLPAALELAAAEEAHVWVAVKDADASVHPMRAILESANRLARHMISLGFRPGDRAVVMLPTSEAWLVGFYGTLLAGGAAVPVGPNLSFGGMDRYAETVRMIIRSAGARFLIGNEAIEPHVAALTTDSSGLEHFVRADQVQTLSGGSGGALPSVDENEPAVIQYTSGTTGTPKGVVLSHRALLANAHMIGERSGMTSKDVGVSWLPLFHDMGLVGALLTSLYHRYPLLLMPVESFLLQPRRWVQWMSKRNASLSVAPNFAYQFVVDRVADRHLADIDLSSWRIAFNGAEAVRPTTLRAFEARFGPLGFGGRVFQSVYGMAENALAATFPPSGTLWRTTELGEREVTSVGTPLAGVTVAIQDETGEPAAVGSVGNIRLKSPSLMSGYFRDDEKTAEVLSDGWLDTGDLGFIQGGELFVTGRKKELIIKRGRNYAPEEFENVALDAGKGRVLRAAALGAADDRGGTERIVVVLETRSMTEHERDVLTREVNGALVAAIGLGADDTVIVPPHTIERTTSGKIRRATLSERYAALDLPGQVARHVETGPEGG